MGATKKGDSGGEVDCGPALISVEPNQNSVAVAVGSDLRIFDLRGDHGVTLLDSSGAPPHNGCIRAIRYSADGQLFVSSGDDKLVRIWSTVSWMCIQTLCSSKRVSAVAISIDKKYVCFADKFGSVWVAALNVMVGRETGANNIAEILLAHYCSIITSLEFSPDGHFIVSADRDSKIRVTVLPQDLLDGAHEIQCYCLGHTEFVSCTGFVCSKDGSDVFLLSGGGDSTVGLWDIFQGTLLDMCDVGTKAGVRQDNKELKEFCPVLDLRVIPKANIVAVSLLSLQGIVLLGCDLCLKSIHVTKVIPLDQGYTPTSMGVGLYGDVLWMVSGASNLREPGSCNLASIRVLSGFRSLEPHGSQHRLAVLTGGDVPGGRKLAETLQGSLDFETWVLAGVYESVKSSMLSVLVKKQYSVTETEHRKCHRNDKKIKL